MKLVVEQKMQKMYSWLFSLQLKEYNLILSHQQRGGICCLILSVNKSYFPSLSHLKLQNVLFRTRVPDNCSVLKFWPAKTLGSSFQQMPVMGLACTDDLQ